MPKPLETLRNHIIRYDGPAILHSPMADDKIVDYGVAGRLAGMRVADVLIDPKNAKISYDVDRAYWHTICWGSSVMKAKLEENPELLVQEFESELARTCPYSVAQHEKRVSKTTDYDLFAKGLITFEQLAMNTEKDHAMRVGGVLQADVTFVGDGASAAALYPVSKLTGL